MSESMAMTEGSSTPRRRRRRLRRCHPRLGPPSRAWWAHRPSDHRQLAICHGQRISQLDSGAGGELRAVPDTGTDIVLTPPPAFSTDGPTDEPTDSPAGTPGPTLRPPGPTPTPAPPTDGPTPTRPPTAAPTNPPTSPPTARPTAQPTAPPTASPTRSPEPTPIPTFPATPTPTPDPAPTPTLPPPPTPALRSRPSRVHRSRRATSSRLSPCRRGGCGSHPRRARGHQVRSPWPAWSRRSRRSPGSRSCG